MKQIMQQAQAMQKKIMKKQEEMKNTDFTGESGNGAVKITLNGAYEMKKIEIDEKILDDKETLEDLILVAYNNCRDKILKESKDGFNNMGIDQNLLNGIL